MFIHIGSNLTISDRVCVGIFNVETLGLSEENKWITDNLKPEDKVAVIDVNNKITATNVSPFTIIKRDSIDKEELIWSRENDKNL
ncbi:MAG TPA: hypothetical protein PK514_00165 [Spirochaetota bacterium]|nr:hypothetical protein [Spirochaetota bacterium]